MGRVTGSLSRSGLFPDLVGASRETLTGRGAHQVSGSGPSGLPTKPVIQSECTEIFHVEAWASKESLSGYSVVPCRVYGISIFTDSHRQRRLLHLQAVRYTAKK